MSAEPFALNDPFIMLADDHLDIGERPVGGPHPHAGFETVTLVLDGAIYDRDEGGVIAAGDVQWMTAGRALRVAAGDEGARLVLYAGQPQGGLTPHGTRFSLVAAHRVCFPAVVARPSMRSPITRPAYAVSPAFSVI